MRRATDLEIKHFITYRANHVALVQRLGKLTFDEDMSSHDNDKIETNRETLNKWALWNAYKNNEYKPNTADIDKLNKLVVKHVCSQKHHPEFWDVTITPNNYDNAEQIKATHMSKKALKEMCCDWSAVALYKNQPIFEYYNTLCCGDNPKFLFTLNQKKFIIDCLSKIERAIKDENITWLGKDYTAEQIEPLRESYYEDTSFDYDKIIYSSEFKNWFGDWKNDPQNASKAVDANNFPLILYHGTGSTFNSFSTYSIGDSSSNDGIFGKGFYFTPDYDIAHIYAEESLDNNKHVKKVFLCIKHPYYLTQEILNKQYSDDLIKEAQETRNSYYKDLDSPYSILSYDMSSSQLVDMYLKIKSGETFDGVIYINEKSNAFDYSEYVVTRPNQIKSINNNGNFSEDSDNIYENKNFVSHLLLEKYFATKGYDWDKGMSNRAVQAYNDGKMPITYWKNNKTLNNAIIYEGDASNDVADILTSLPIEAKLNLLINNGEYHHTSRYYNITYFYEMSDLSHVSVKDAEKFKQEWEDYSKESREYNKFKKSITFGVKNNTEIIEDDKGIVKFTYTDYLSDCYIPDDIIQFLNNDLDISFSGNIYIYGKKPKSATPEEGTLRIQRYGKDTIALTQYNVDTENYEVVSQFVTKASCKDLLNYSKDKYKGTVSKEYLKIKPQWTATISSTLTEILNKPKTPCKYVIVAPDGRILKDTITEDIQKAKQIRRELVDTHGLVFFSIENIKESIEGCSNTSDNFSGQAPEHVSKLFIPHENEVLKDTKLKEFKDNTIEQLCESIIDVPQKEYYNGVLTPDDKMVSALRKQIIETIYNWKEQIDFDFNVYKILAKGSLLTKRYNDTTDLDITVYTDMSREQLDQVYNIIPKGNKIIVDGNESSHILDIYILTKGEKTEDHDADNIYDIAHNKWIKRSGEYNNEIPLNYALEVANFFINGCTIALSNYNNDKIMYEYYKSLDPKEQEITQKEKDKAIAEVKTSLQTDLDGLRLALHMVSAFRHETYGEDPNPFKLSIDILSDNPHNSLNEVMIKLIEKFGIREELRNKAEECSKLLGLDKESLEESSKPNKTVAFVFGRMNVPTIGHLLLLTKLQSIQADAHFVYTSHSQDNKKNPLDYATKASLIKTMIKENNLNVDFVDTDARTIMDVVFDIYSKGYKNLIFVGGSDKVYNIVDLIKKYNNSPIDTTESIDKKVYNFDTIIGVEAGLRDPDSDTIEGVSATKVREYAKNGDLKNFAYSFGVKDSFITKAIFKQLQEIL